MLSLFLFVVLVVVFLWGYGNHDTNQALRLRMKTMEQSLIVKRCSFLEDQLTMSQARVRELEAKRDDPEPDRCATIVFPSGMRCLKPRRHAGRCVTNIGGAFVVGAES